MTVSIFLTAHATAQVNQSLDVRYWHSFFVNSGLISDSSNKYLTQRFQVPSVVVTYVRDIGSGSLLVNLNGSFLNRPFGSDSMSGTALDPDIIVERDRVSRYEAELAYLVRPDDIGTYYLFGGRANRTAVKAEYELTMQGKRFASFATNSFFAEAGIGLARPWGDKNNWEFFASAVALAGVANLHGRQEGPLGVTPRDKLDAAIGIDSSLGVRYRFDKQPLDNGTVSVSARYRVYTVGSPAEWQEGRNSFVHGPELGASIRW